MTIRGFELSICFNIPAKALLRDALSVGGHSTYRPRTGSAALAFGSLRLQCPHQEPLCLPSRNNWVRRQITTAHNHRLTTCTSNPTESQPSMCGCSIVS